MKILFICTHNRCRSILSEAITNHLSNGSIHAVSAGSAPAGEVHPLTLKYLAEHNIPTHGLQSQSWDDFDTEDVDAVVTVCDRAASESCPVWFGNCAKTHWGLPDPSAIQNDDAAQAQAFSDVINTIKMRVSKLMDIDWSQLNQQEKQDALQEIIAHE